MSNCTTSALRLVLDLLPTYSYHSHSCLSSDNLYFISLPALQSIPSLLSARNLDKAGNLVAARSFQVSMNDDGAFLDNLLTVTFCLFPLRTEPNRTDLFPIIVQAAYYQHVLAYLRTASFSFGR
jgi:hypothetical protein